VTAWTALSLLSASTDHLRKFGSESPRLDAELLLARVLGVTRLRLYMMHDMPVDDAQRSALRDLVARRAKGEPVAYLLGEREFHGHLFRVDRRVLVPRPETEFLVDAGIEAIDRLTAARGADAPISVLDLCTGSGCVAVSVKLARPAVEVVAVDVSKEALDVARANADELCGPGAVACVLGDLAEAVDGRRFDVVLSNPPYVTDVEYAELSAHVRDHEPALALRSGDDALRFHRRILAACVAGLCASDGRVAMELGTADGASELAASVYPKGRIETRRDYAGFARVLIVDP